MPSTPGKPKPSALPPQSTANLLMTLILVSVVWRYADHAQLVRPDMADEDMETPTKRLTHVGAFTWW